MSGATENGESTSSATRWEGYSNYELVSKRASKAIDDALDAYALLHGAHAEDAAVQPDFAAEARSKILSAAIRMLVEMREDRDAVDTYEEILDRWEGENGYINRLLQSQLHQEVPGWLFQFVIDIRQAGWSLGYLQAGRHSRVDEDPVEGDVNQVLGGL